MVVRDGVDGLTPGSDLDGCCIVSEGHCMESESGSTINADAKRYICCSRKSHKSEHCQNAGETNSRRIVPSRSVARRCAASRNPRLNAAAQSMKVKLDAAPPYRKSLARESTKANPRKRVKRFIAACSRKAQNNSTIVPLNSAADCRSKYLTVSDENSEDINSPCESREFNEELIAEDVQDKPDEANNFLIPGLADDVVQMCLVRVSRSLYGSFYTVSKKFCALFKSGELYKVRRDLRISEEWVYLLNSGQSAWRAFNPKDGGHWRTLPLTPADKCFELCDKESLAAGTHLLVIGREIQGLVVWRYDLVSDSWSYAPPMITPRCLHASASSGEFGYVAGGVHKLGPLCSEVTNNAERYNSLTGNWESLPPMLKRRKLCSGFFMDGKFWVIGGLDENENPLTCGEHYDLRSRSWKLIRNMFHHSAGASSKAPPLVAVVDNKLYALDVSINKLNVYCQKSNTWTSLGDVPVRAEQQNGWGLAFKALDGQLLLVGGCSAVDYSTSIYSWKPSSGAPVEWSFLTTLVPQRTFVFNCAVMSA